jgi:hypothetical protein
VHSALVGENALPLSIEGDARFDGIPVRRGFESAVALRGRMTAATAVGIASLAGKLAGKIFVDGLTGVMTLT